MENVMDPISEAKLEQVLKNNKVAIFIVAYNAAKHITGVLDRIPKKIATGVSEIYIIDDSSQDETLEVSRKVSWREGYAPLKIYKTPYNQGYGGNQRLGYLYAIERGFDIVVLLHADGQYAPEYLPNILAPYADGADAVFGSRFMPSSGALKGGMPLYKWIGNRILTFFQNFFLGSSMSEMHSGYRSYRVKALASVPFKYNSLGFDFDADIIVQFLAAKLKIVEVPIPTYYGDEICRVNGMDYAWRCIKSVIQFRLMQVELFYDPKFDISDASTPRYKAKIAPTSLHYFMKNQKLPSGVAILDVGGGVEDSVGRYHASCGANVMNIDKAVSTRSEIVQYRNMDLDVSWKNQMPESIYEKKFDVIFALDVIEHLAVPEQGVDEIFSLLKEGGVVYASTGNIAFLPLRIMLMLGQFNYGRRGILDLTHKRLFTVGQFKHLFINHGFVVKEVVGFGPPIADVTNKQSFLICALDRLASRLAKWWPELFAFQLLLICSRVNSPEELLQQTTSKSLCTNSSVHSSN